MGRLLVLLPAYNEESALLPLLAELEQLRVALAPAWHTEVLVVDDGSTDGTAAAAEKTYGELSVHLERHPGNRGLGATLKSGVDWFLTHFATAEEPCALATMDADGTHPPALLAAMLNAMYDAQCKARCDVVIASRYAPGGSEHGLPPLRLFYSRLASRTLSVLAPLRGVRDYTCGYRLYDATILQRAAGHYGTSLVSERGFVCMAELLIKLARRGACCCEVGFALHYELKSGPSKLNVPATIMRYAVLAWRVLFTRHFG